jgi:hypothetical protein
VRVRAWLLAFTLCSGCRILEAGLAGEQVADPPLDAAATALDASTGIDAQPAVDEGEPAGVVGPASVVGCADGTREGFRDVPHWPDIAGCAGAFQHAGLMGTPDLAPTCSRRAGDTGLDVAGTGCTAADLCAPGWHICRGSADVAAHSASGGCEGAVAIGEPRFFAVAAGASPMGICSPDLTASNDLHGCGGLGQPEAETCAPLSRRMGFADCLATGGVWSCGASDADNLREAAIVTKPGPAMGGVLCCRD